MVDQTALRHAFADFAEALLQRYDIGDVLYRLTDQVVAVLGVDGAGVSLGLTSDGLRFVTATDQRVAKLEGAQIDAGEGPCFDAYRTGELITVSDLQDEPRWDDYRRIADEQQFRAVAGIPMPVVRQRIGALDLYRTAPHHWEPEELEVAQLLANVASGYILNWQTLDRQTTLAQQLQGALDSRIVIEQAKGVLAGRHGIDVAAAFERLRKHSRDSQTKIHEVARRIVSGQLQL